MSLGRACPARLGKALPSTSPEDLEAFLATQKGPAEGGLDAAALVCIDTEDAAGGRGKRQGKKKGAREGDLELV